MPFYDLAPGAGVGTAPGIEHIVIPPVPLLAADEMTNTIGTASPVTNITIETVVPMRSVVSRNDDEDTVLHTQRETLRVTAVPFTAGDNTTPLPCQITTFRMRHYSLSDGPSRLMTDTPPLATSGHLTSSGDFFLASDVPSTRNHYTTHDISSASDVPSTKDHYTTHDISQGRTVPPASTSDQRAADALSPTNSAGPSLRKAPRQYDEIPIVEGAATSIIQVVSSPSQTLSGIAADSTFTTTLPTRTRATKDQEERHGVTHERPWITRAETTASEDIASSFISASFPVTTRTCEIPATSERGESTA